MKACSPVRLTRKPRPVIGGRQNGNRFHRLDKLRTEVRSRDAASTGVNHFSSPDATATGGAALRALIQAAAQRCSSWPMISGIAAALAV
jgi:hypothetical protein